MRKIFPLMRATTLPSTVTLDSSVEWEVQPKIDGIRATKIAGRMVSKTGIAFPNKNLQAFFEELPEGFDGELAYPTTYNSASFLWNYAQSIVMSADAPLGDLCYYIFDTIDGVAGPTLTDDVTIAPNAPRAVRAEALRNLTTIYTPMGERVRLVASEVIYPDEVVQELIEAINFGGEGIMLRAQHVPYKHGTSTLLEGGLLKMKAEVEEDARVEGVFQLVGKDGVRDELGGVICSWDKRFPGVTFRVGSGFSAAARKHFWINQDQIIGKTIRIRYNELTVNKKPRNPVYISVRDPRDILGT